MGNSGLIRLVVLVVVGGLIAPAQPAGAAGTCTLAPELRAITVNQGLGSYSPLVRGKETLFRAFLGKPKCALSTDSIQLTGAQLKVTTGSTVLATITSPTPGLVQTFPQIADFAAAPVADWVGDPIFDIPGSALAPTSTTASFSVTFTITIGFAATPGSTASVAGTSPLTFASLTGSRTAITSTVDKKTNALRILVQPMGDPTQTLDSQFSASALRAVQDGMLTLSRIAPVPDGTDALTGSTGGVRYTVNVGLLDVRTFLTGGKFCGNAANFDGTGGVKAKLDQFLQAWNAANPLAPADRVLGVVDEALSLGSSSGCAEGWAAVNGSQAWARAVYSTSPSFTGGVAAMEMMHTGGDVPASRYDPYNPWHSPNVAADGSSPSRAYNVAQRSFMKTGNKTVMDFTTGFNNTNTLAESSDFGYWRCLLGGTTTTDCSTSGVVGTNVGVGTNLTVTATGNAIVGSNGATTVSDVNSYFTPGMPQTPALASQLQLVQNSNGAVLRSDPCPITFATSLHNNSSPPGQPPSPNNSQSGSFYCAEPYNPNATQIQLLNNGVALYSRSTGAAPSITSAGTSSASCTESSPTITHFAIPTTGGNPFKITTGPDGNLWFTETVGKIGKSTTGGAITEYTVPRWASSGDLGVVLANPVLVTLGNSSVLAVGGQDAGNKAQSSAFLYDPGHGTWTATAPMNTPRFGHTATALIGGKVLVTGGVDTNGAPVKSAEVFDPLTGSWSITGGMTAPRAFHTATLLNSGQVLVTGGDTTGSTEIWTPGTGAFSAGPTMSVPRQGHTATLLPNAKVLVAGGNDNSNNALTSAEIFDPAANAGAGSWTATGGMATARVGHTADMLANNKVLVAGGRSDASTVLASSELYDFAAGTWSATGNSMSVPRVAHTATALSGLKVLVTGGLSSNSALASAELYDPTADRWSPTDSLITARRSHGAAFIRDTIVVAGGVTGTSTLLAASENYAPSLLPNGIASGSDGDLWFVESDAGRIGKMTPTGLLVAQFPIPTPNAGPRGIAAGPDGNLWFTETNGGTIGTITPSGAVTEFAVPGEGVGPDNIVGGPDGNLWFTEQFGGQIARITTAGVITEYPTPTAGSGPRGITVGPDGNLWVAETAVNKIARITTAGVITEFDIPTDGSSDTLGITGGPDGQVWFAEHGLSQIGSIGQQGEFFVINQYADLDNIFAPFGITTGPDNNLWFAQRDSLGRLTPCLGGLQTTATATFSGDPNDGRMDLFSCGNGVCYPIAVALPPSSVTGSSATFDYNFNSSSCGGTTVRLLANNGIQQSQPRDTSSGTACDPKPPVPSITSPIAGQTFLSYDVIPFKGSATSQGSPITGLQFSTNLTTSAVPAGGTVDLTPPANGWPEGTFNVSLQATAGSLSATTSATFTIKKDSAHVGKADSDIAALTCKPTNVTTYQPFADWDGDGIPNVNDPNICTPAGFYPAVVVSVPGTLTSQTSSVVVGMVVPYRSVSQINGTSVMIKSVAGKPVSFSPNNRGWTTQTMPPPLFSQVQTSVPGLVDNLFGAVAFDAPQLAAYLKSQGINNRSVTFEVVGGSSTLPAWSFQAFVTISVALN